MVHVIRRRGGGDRMPLGVRFVSSTTTATSIITRRGYVVIYVHIFMGLYATRPSPKDGPLSISHHCRRV